MPFGYCLYLFAQGIMYYIAFNTGSVWSSHLKWLPEYQNPQKALCLTPRGMLDTSPTRHFAYDMDTSPTTSTLRLLDISPTGQFTYKTFCLLDTSATPWTVRPLSVNTRECVTYTVFQKIDHQNHSGNFDLLLLQNCHWAWNNCENRLTFDKITTMNMVVVFWNTV